MKVEENWEVPRDGRPFISGTPVTCIAYLFSMKENLSIFVYTTSVPAYVKRTWQGKGDPHGSSLFIVEEYYQPWTPAKLLPESIGNGRE